MLPESPCVHEAWIHSSSQRGETLCVEPIDAGVSLISLKRGAPLSALLQGHRPLYGTASTIRDQIPFTAHEQQARIQRGHERKSTLTQCISAHREVGALQRALEWWLRKQPQLRRALTHLEQQLELEAAPLVEARQRIVGGEGGSNWKHQLTVGQAARVVMLVLQWAASQSDQEAGNYCHQRMSQCFHLLDQAWLDEQLTSLVAIPAGQGQRYFKAVTHWPLSMDLTVPDLDLRLLLRQHENKIRWLVCALPIQSAVLRREEVSTDTLEASEVPVWIDKRAGKKPVYLGAMADNIRIHHHQYDLPSFEGACLSEVTYEIGMVRPPSFSSLSTLRDACRARGIAGFTKMDRAEMLYQIAQRSMEQYPVPQIADETLGCFLEETEEEVAPSETAIALVCHAMASGLVPAGGASNPLRFTGEHSGKRLLQPLNPYHH